MNSSKITTVKSIRIKNEVAEYFNGKPLNRYVEGLYECIQDGRIVEKEDGIEVKSGRYDMTEYEKVCKEAGCSPVLMLQEVVKGIRAEIENP